MKHRKILSALLALVMVLALTVPALAAGDSAPRVTLLDYDDYGERCKIETTADAVLATQERVSCTDGVDWTWGEKEAYTVKTGCTLYYSSNTSMALVPAEKMSDEPYEDYKYSEYVTGDKRIPLTTGEEEGTMELVLGPEHIGSWVVLRRSFPAVVLNVVEGGGAAPTTPAEPEQPAKPEKPAEPTTPSTPEKPAEPTTPAEPEKPTEPTTPTQPAAAGTYTAKRYDTWGQLALNNYGTYGVWKQLMKANGNKAVKADMVITLPEKLGSYTRLPAQVLAEGEQFYTVKAGDTLGQIAVATYGDMSMYKAIFERNSDRLKNANMIYEGQVLVLPVKK